MSLLEAFIKNNYKLKEEWKVYGAIDASKLKNVLSISEEYQFYYSNIDNKTLLHELITNEPRLKQIIENLENIVLPYDIINKKTITIKSSKHDGMYLSDDSFARVIFSFDEKTNKLEVYDIYIQILFIKSEMIYKLKEYLKDYGKFVVTNKFWTLLVLDSLKYIGIEQ